MTPVYPSPDWMSAEGRLALAATMSSHERYLVNGLRDTFGLIRARTIPPLDGEGRGKQPLCADEAAGGG